MTKAVIVFFICLGVYLVGLLAFFIIKKIIAKKHYNKRLKDEELNDESQKKD